MTAALSKVDALDQVLIQNDLSKLTNAERVQYYMRVCETLGLNPATRPFEYIRLNGRDVLYAKRDATDQLRKRDGISVTITSREITSGVYVVTARGKRPDGREDESIGAVPVEGLKGDALSNAMMKAETKAKRRVTLSICGLGFLDESEVESVARTEPHAVAALPPAEPESAPAEVIEKYLERFEKAQTLEELKAIGGEVNKDARMTLESRNRLGAKYVERKRALEDAKKNGHAQEAQP